MRFTKPQAAKQRESAMSTLAGCHFQSVDAPFNLSMLGCKQKCHARALGSVTMHNSRMAVPVEGFVRTWAWFSYARLYAWGCEALAKQDMRSLDATSSYLDLISCFDNGLAHLCSNESYRASAVRDLSGSEAGRDCVQ